MRGGTDLSALTIIIVSVRLGKNCIFSHDSILRVSNSGVKKNMKKTGQKKILEREKGSCKGVSFITKCEERLVDDLNHEFEAQTDHGMTENV